MGVPPQPLQGEARGEAGSVGHAQPRLTVLAVGLSSGRERRIPGGSAAQGACEVLGDVGLSRWEGVWVRGGGLGFSL